MRYSDLSNIELVEEIVSKALEQAERIMAGKKNKIDDCYDSISKAHKELKGRGDEALNLLWEYGKDANDNAKCYVASYCFYLRPLEARGLLEGLSKSSQFPFVKTNARMTLEAKLGE